MVKSLAAKLGVTMDEQVAKLIEDMSNVDDIILGGRQCGTNEERA